MHWCRMFGWRNGAKEQILMLLASSRLCSARLLLSVNALSAPSLCWHQLYTVLCNRCRIPFYTPYAGWQGFSSASRAVIALMLSSPGSSPPNDFFFAHPSILHSKIIHFFMNLLSKIESNEPRLRFTMSFCCFFVCYNTCSRLWTYYTTHQYHTLY